MRQLARRQALDQLSHGGVHREDRARRDQVQKMRSSPVETVKLAQTVNTRLVVCDWGCH